MKKKDVKVGIAVTCKEEVPAYYSSLRDCPDPKINPHLGVFFKPGMIGIVNVVDVPSVCRERVSFCCVDFTSPNGVTHRVGLLYNNIKKPTRNREYNSICRLLELKSLAYSKYIGKDEAAGRFSSFHPDVQDQRVAKYKKVGNWLLRELHRIGYEKSFEIRRQRIEGVLCTLAGQ